MKTSPAESPWCNGTVERHNGILANMIEAVLHDTGCNIEIAVAWAVNSKNSLNNVHGFSSYQLVFGRNPTIPSTLELENLPTLNTETTSTIIRENMNAIEAARKAFIQLENNARIKRALRDRVYERANMKYVSGDSVFYKRQKTKGPWLGPATVVGHLDNQVLVKHGGCLIRVHPCKLILRTLANKYVINSNQEVNTVRRPTVNEEDQESDVECGIDKEKSPEPINVNPSASSWTPVDVETDLQPGDVLRFREPGSNEWTGARMISNVPQTRSQSGTLNVQQPYEQKQQQISASTQEIEKLTENVITLTTDDDVPDTHLTFFSSDEERMKRAKMAELRKFEEYGVYKEVKFTGQRTISCRWVFTRKGEDIKARLVARGFEEINSDQVDAPTVNVTSLYTAFSLIAGKGWTVEALDVTSAFLQADEMNRDVFIKPPADVRKQGIVWRLNRPMYGLGDSARKWYLTFTGNIQSTGCDQSKLDKSVFRSYHDSKLSGLLCTHVDDVFYAGSTRFKDGPVRTILKTFKISKQAAGVFTYLGLQIEQDHVTHAIRISQDEYANSIKQYMLGASRRKELDCPLTEEETTGFQRILGKIHWLTGRTRPDLSYDAMELATYAKNPKVKDLLAMNKVVRKAQEIRSTLHFQAIDLAKDKLKIVFYSDASLGNLPNGVDSGRGYVILLANQDCKVNIITWACNKIKRVAHSTFASETLGCSDAMSAAIFCRQLLCEMLFNDPHSKLIPIIGFIDSRQLYDHLHSTKQCAEKRIRLDIAEIQEVIVSGIIEDIHWIPTGKMLADCLTKRGACPKNLLEVLDTGICEDLRPYI